MSLLYIHLVPLPVPLMSTATLTVAFFCIFVLGVQHLWLVGRRARWRCGYRPQGFPAPCLHSLSSNRYRFYHQHYRPLLWPNTQKTVPVVLILIAAEVFSVVDLPFMASVGW